MKAVNISALLLLCVTVAAAAKLPAITLLTTEQGFCEINEERPENKEACNGKPFGTLVSYPGNCSRFLVCNCVYPTVVECPGELYFNPKSKTCDWPRNVPSCNDGSGMLPTTKQITKSTKPTESTSPAEPCDLPPGLSANSCESYPDGTLQRYPYNCNAYINCTQGCSVLNYCIPGKVFNVRLMICDTPDTAQCIELEIPTSTTTEAITTTTPTTTTEIITTSTEAVTHTTHPACESLVGVNDDICDSTEEYGMLQRYPYDCKAYINCTSGCPQLDYCKSGKVFNELLMICDDPSDEYCKEEPFPTTTELTTIMPIVTTQSPTLPPDFNNAVCNDKPSGALLPYTKDCASFIVCVHKKALLQQCPDGWLFNPELLICDESKDVNCYTGQTTLQPTTTTPIYESCMGKPYGISFPYVDNCQKYYFCWGNGTSSILHCPFDNWYNPETGNCGPEVAPDACRLTTATTTTTTKPTAPQNVCENQPASTSFPDKTKCDQYIYCLGDGASMVLQCPPKNYFNPATGNCGPHVSETACREELTTTTTIITTNPTTATPSESTTLAPPQQGCNICGNNSNGELMPYPGSCNKYIVCTVIAPIAFSCPNNWQFNLYTKSCDLPENVKCGQGEVTTTPAPALNVCQGAKKGVTRPYKNNCRFYIECLGSDLWMLNSCMWGEYFDPNTQQCGADVSSNACQTDVTTSAPSTEAPTDTTTAAAKPKGICYGKPTGEMIPYPNNCTKFIVCQSPIPVGYSCNAGLEYSTEQHKCVDPSEANCSIKTTVATTATTTTSTGGGSTLGPDCKNSEPGATYPFHADCSKYIICVNDLAQIVPCMPNTYYNLEKKRCDCQTSPTACFGNGESTTEGATTPELTTKKTTATEVTPTTEIDTTTSEVTPTTENPMGPCYGEPDGMLVPYPYNCSKYIICLSPIAVGYDCPLGQEFNAHLKQCDLPQDANCGWTTATTASLITTPTTTALTTRETSKTTLTETPTSTATEPTITTPTVAETTLTTPLETTETTSTAPTTTTTEAIVTAPTRTTPTTTVATTTLEPNTQNVCCDKPLFTVVAYPGECDRYIQCLYPVPTTITCANNTIFDMSLLRCVPKDQYKCQPYQLN